MKEIDFSCKHNILIRNEDGSTQPMDQPYFASKEIAPGTWQCLTDGDYFYLVEGEEEALVIDSGYGCGNVRAFCQGLTDKPVRRIANTHHHFDHTANNSYFDCAYLSAETQPLATIPFPSFEGIEFPRDYPVQVIDEGFVFHLGGRDLETYAVHNHAPGSLVFLDRKERLLFTGDELMPAFFDLRTDVENVIALLTKLDDLSGSIDRFCGGPGIMEADLAGRYLEAVRYLADGHWSEGEPLPPRQVPEVADGPTIYDRRRARPCDMPKPNPQAPTRYALHHKGVTLFYQLPDTL